MEVYEAHKDEDFSIEIIGKTFTERPEAGEMLLDAFQGIKDLGEIVTVGSYKGFTLGIKKSFMQESLLVLSCNARYSTELSSNALGSITRIENRYKRIENAKAMIEQNLNSLIRTETLQKLSTISRSSMQHFWKKNSAARENSNMSLIWMKR